MTDPKTAARSVAGRLAAREISIKHVQALDLVAAGCGFQDRSKLADLAQLPVLLRVNARLLASAATVLARHDQVRRQTIVDTTSDVLLGRAVDMRKVHAPGSASATAASVIAIGDAGETLFWNDEDGWGDLQSATVFPDRTGDLPTAGMTPRQISTIRWMDMDGATLRAAVDAAVTEIDGENETTIEYPGIEGERPLDYERIADVLATRRVFVRPLSPLEIAVRDGSQRASLYLAFPAEGPGTPDAQLAEWIHSVEHAFRGGLTPSTARQVELLMDGDAAVSVIADLIEPSDRLHAWRQVAGHPDLVSTDAPRNGRGIDLNPLTDALSTLKSAFRSEESADHASARTDALRHVKGSMDAADRERIAQEAYEAHDFGSDVADHDGWERQEPGDLWTRKVYVKAYDDASDDIGDTVQVVYTVLFWPGTAKIRGAYQIDAAGQVRDTDLSPIEPTIDDEAMLAVEGIADPVPLSIVLGTETFEGHPAGRLIVDEIVSDIHFSSWERSGDRLSTDVATRIASEGIRLLRNATSAAEREQARDMAIVSAIPASSVEDECWGEVSRAVDDMLDLIEAAFDDLDEPPVEWDRDEAEDVLREAAFDRLRRKDGSVPEDAIGNRDNVEILFHLIPNGADVEDMCHVRGPFLDPDKVVLDDAFRFALRSLGVSPREWARFVRETRDGADPIVEPAQDSARPLPMLRGDALLSPEQISELVENACSTSFSFVAYASVPLSELLDLDLSRPFALSNVAVATMNVMSGTFQDIRIEREVVFRDGVDGRLFSTDCGPYASPNDMMGLVMSFYEARIYDPETRALGERAGAALDAVLAVDGLVRDLPGIRPSWRRSGSDGLVLTADVGTRDPMRRYALVEVEARFRDVLDERPEVSYSAR